MWWTVGNSHFNIVSIEFIPSACPDDLVVDAVWRWGAEARSFSLVGLERDCTNNYLNSASPQGRA